MFRRLFFLTTALQSVRLLHGRNRMYNCVNERVISDLCVPCASSQCFYKWSTLRAKTLDALPI